MTRLYIYTLAAALLFMITGSVRADEKKVPEGKQIFMEKKCTMCHSVQAAGIPEKKKQKGPDLSNIGSQKDAAFLAKFLKKEETVDGKKHMMSFRGTDKQLKTLTNWLAEQKAGKKKSDSTSEKKSSDAKK